MTTEKKIEANKKNALVSTGPVTDEGKTIISQNAIKHGIFAKDLIISTGDGKEDEQEYRELLDGLVVSLNPAGQMECLLVEKIAVDFWRLRRVLRFEAGSTRKFLDMAISNYYNKADWEGKKEHRENEKIDEDIAKQKEFIDWNNHYIKALKSGAVTFDNPTWSNESLESNLEEDLILIMESIGEKIMTEDEYLDFKDKGLEFEQMKAILKRAGYVDKDIAGELIECLKKQNKGYEKRIEELNQERLKNAFAEDVAIKVNSLPAGDTYEKVIKYEKAIQRSILQNIALLKRLQSMH
ncbi:MAG TPA: hypothetical protein VJA17_04625 [Candidatus Omnitrophota bacterium]|nr:hypothetical protein [Candidatus Omnitrophota bacterium]